MFEKSAQPSSRSRSRGTVASLDSTGDPRPLRLKTALFMALVGCATLAIVLASLPDRGATPPTSADIAALLAKSDIKVSLGASVTDVQMAYPEVSDLKNMQRDERSMYSQSIPDALSFFFDKPHFRLSVIRVDPPFAGQILGVKIGDNRSHLLSTLGNPSKAPFKAFIWDEAYLYRATESSTVRFDVTTRDDSHEGGLKKGVVSRIFVNSSRAVPD